MLLLFWTYSLDWTGIGAINLFSMLNSTDTEILAKLKLKYGKNLLLYLSC